MSRLTKWRLIAIAAALAGVAVLTWLRQYAPPPEAGIKDFMTFYMGAKLVGTPNLYNEAAGWAVQDQILGKHSAIIPFVRLPFWAYFAKPLLSLPYSQAGTLWTGLIVFSVIAFIWLFPADRWVTLGLTCWSIPVVACLLLGQDTTFLLLWLALSIRCWKRGKPYLAGLLLSLCMAKFHFLTLVPLLILLQRRWRFAWGLATGAAALLAVSFAVQGPHWPLDYLHMVLQGNSRPFEYLMYNFRGAFHDSAYATYFQIAGCALVALLTAGICRLCEFDLALCACLAGALMVSPHVYAQDYVLTLPLCALLITRRAQMFPAVVPIALLLSFPFAHLSARAVVLAAVGLLGGVFYSAWRAKNAVGLGAEHAGVPAEEQVMVATAP